MFLIYSNLAALYILGKLFIILHLSGIPYTISYIKRMHYLVAFNKFLLEAKSIIQCINLIAESKTNFVSVS